MSENPVPSDAHEYTVVTTDEAAPEDLLAFKRAFRRHAAGVAVITARRPDGIPVGFTATSLSSLSAVPPLATFNMARTSSSWSAISTTERVVIHMLGARNRHLAEIMSGDASRRFEGGHWHPGTHGLPLLDDVPSWMIGRVIERLHIRNNAVIVVQIESGGLGQEDEALIYHERQYFVPASAE